MFTLKKAHRSVQSESTLCLRQTKTPAFASTKNQDTKDKHRDIETKTGTNRDIKTNTNTDTKTKTKSKTDKSAGIANTNKQT